MATQEKVSNLARGFHDQLSNVVIACLFFLKRHKPERGFGTAPCSGTSVRVWRDLRVILFVCFPRRSALWQWAAVGPSNHMHGFTVSVVLSPTELGNQRVLDQLVAESAPRSSMMNTFLCLGLENNDQGWTGLGLSQGACGLSAPI